MDKHIPKKGSFAVKIGLAEMLKRGAVIEVRTIEEAKIAEEVGAVAVALHRESSGIAEIQKAVSIPLMAKVRVGHFVEAQILEALFVDFIDESEELERVDHYHYIEKEKFDVPFVSTASDLGEALRRISEGASMIRTPCKGEIAETVAALREILSDIKGLTVLEEGELFSAAEAMRASLELVRKVASSGILPVPLFAAGGISTPADVALMMQLGAESIFIGSEIFEGKNPKKRLEMLVAAVNHFENPEMLAKVTMGHREAMKDDAIDTKKKEDAIPHRNW